MRRKLARVLLSLMLVASVVLPAAPVFAGTNLFGDACDLKEGADSAVCQRSGGDPITSQDGIIHRVTQLIAIIAGIAAVIVIAVGGVRYIASNGDAEQINRAKRTILWAVIGLVVIVLGQTIINFVVSRL